MASKYDKILNENEYLLKLNKEDDYKKIAYILRLTAARRGLNVSCTPGVFVCGLETFNVLFVKRTDKKPPKVGGVSKKRIGNLFEKTYKRIQKIKMLKRKGLKAKEIAESLKIKIDAYYTFFGKYKKLIEPEKLPTQSAKDTK